MPFTCGTFFISRSKQQTADTQLVRLCLCVCVCDYETLIYGFYLRAKLRPVTRPTHTQTHLPSCLSLLLLLFARLFLCHFMTHNTTLLAIKQHLLTLVFQCNNNLIYPRAGYIIHVLCIDTHGLRECPKKDASCNDISLKWPREGGSICIQFA